LQVQEPTAGKMRPGAQIGRDADRAAGLDPAGADQTAGAAAVWPLPSAPPGGAYYSLVNHFSPFLNGHYNSMPSAEDRNACIGPKLPK